LGGLLSLVDRVLIDLRGKGNQVIGEMFHNYILSEIGGTAGAQVWQTWKGFTGVIEESLVPHAVTCVDRPRLILKPPFDPADGMGNTGKPQFVSSQLTRQQS
jgi:hypothetical protein